MLGSNLCQNLRAGLNNFEKQSFLFAGGGGDLAEVLSQAARYKSFILILLC